jgi:hypothetical protein
MLAQLDHDAKLSATFEAFLEGLRNQRLKYYASELQQVLELDSITELADSVNRAISACQTQKVVIDDHFQPIYRCEETQLIHDWKLSPFAYCLVMMNANPAHSQVARFQFQLVQRVMNKEAAK